MSERTKRKAAAIVVIFMVCMVFSLGDRALPLSLFFVPLMYLLGWLHGKLDELEEHIRSLDMHKAFVNTLMEIDSLQERLELLRKEQKSLRKQAE